MKTLLTLALVLLIGTSSSAQVDLKDQKLEADNKKECVVKESKDSKSQKIARVYLYKNSRVKKELKFKTKKNKSKLA